MSGPNQDRVRQAEAALARMTEEWMAHKGVVSIEVSRRWLDGAPTDDIAIRITVLPGSETGIFPETLDDIPVDVIEGHQPIPEA